MLHQTAWQRVRTAIIRALSGTKHAEILFVFFLIYKWFYFPANGTPQAVSKIQVCSFFLEQICTLRSFDSEYAHGPQDVFKSFEILNQNLPQRIFQMWSDTRKQILIFFKWFKGRKSYVYHTWSSSLVNILWCDLTNQINTKETKAYSNSTVSFLYRGFT